MHFNEWGRRLEMSDPENEQPALTPGSPKPTPPKWVPVLPCDFVPAKEASGRSIHDKFSLDRAFVPFTHEVKVDDGTRKIWGISDSLTDSGPLPPGVFTFEQAIKQPWCKNPNGKNRTRYGLYRLCKSIGCYPPALLERQLISEIGYNYALQLQHRKDKQHDTEETRRRRAAKKNNPPRRSNS
jgi:hypothetical protein